LRTQPSGVIHDVTHIALDRFEDDRGFFEETFRAAWFPGSKFVQANLSRSRGKVLRGLHYHLRQEDLWIIPDGEAFVGLVDLRANSPSYLAVETLWLSGPNAVHIPPGVAHGFYAAGDLLMSYLVTAYHDGSDELGVVWSDPELSVPWPDLEPILSARDSINPRWVDVPMDRRPQRRA
jgi:dTDP-4-dehydrorhamnose 3,5-epimerase